MEDPLRLREAPLALAVGTILWTIAVKLAEERLTTLPWWADWVQSWPLEIAWLGLGFAAAWVVLDPHLPWSRWRNWQRARSQIFKVTDYWTEGTSAQPQRRLACVGLLWTTDAAKVELALWLTRNGSEPQLASQIAVGKVVKGQRFRLTIASAPLRVPGEGHACAGEDSPVHLSSANEPAVITVEARFGRRRQRYNVMVVLAPAQQMTLFTIIPEESDPLKWPALAFD